MAQKKKPSVKWHKVGEKKIRIPKFAPQRPKGISYPVYTPMSSAIVDTTPVAPAVGSGAVAGGGAVAGPAGGGGGMGESVANNKSAILESAFGEKYVLTNINGITYKAVVFPDEVN